MIRQCNPVTRSCVPSFTLFSIYCRPLRGKSRPNTAFSTKFSNLGDACTHPFTAQAHICLERMDSCYTRQNFTLIDVKHKFDCKLFPLWAKEPCVEFWGLLYPLLHPSGPNLACKSNPVVCFSTPPVDLGVKKTQI